jgi:hypothetical protein
LARNLTDPRDRLLYRIQKILTLEEAG